MKPKVFVGGEIRDYVRLSYPKWVDGRIIHKEEDDPTIKPLKKEEPEEAVEESSKKKKR